MEADNPAKQQRAPDFKLLSLGWVSTAFKEPQCLALMCSKQTVGQCGILAVNNVYSIRVHLCRLLLMAAGTASLVAGVFAIVVRCSCLICQRSHLMGSICQYPAA